MSPATEPAVPDRDFARAAIPLLREYAERLSELAKHILEHLDQSQKRPGVPLNEYGRAMQDNYSQRLKHLLPPAKELARQASAVVEQGRAGDVKRVELWLRLADFEAALEAASQVVQQISAKK